MLFCAAIASFVLIGFVVPVPHYFPFFGRTTESDGGRLHALPYPNAVVFRSELRNLWLLIVSPLYALGVAAIVYGHFDERWAFNSDLNVFLNIFSLKVGKWITAAAVCFAWWWLHERLLLRKAEVGVGLGHAQLDNQEITYEYFDRDGERRGGSAFPFGQVSHTFPVFMHENDPDFSKPGFGFLFHKFSVIDAKSVPSSVLMAVQRNVAASVAGNAKVVTAAGTDWC